MLVKKQAAGILGIPCRTGPPIPLFYFRDLQIFRCREKGFSGMSHFVWDGRFCLIQFQQLWHWIIIITGRLFFKTCEGTTVSVLWKKGTHINTLKRVSLEKLKHEDWQTKRKLSPLLIHQGLPQKSTWDQWTQLTGVSTFKGLITKVEKFEFLQEFGL